MEIPKRVILASASVRRQEILSSIGLSFELASPQVDETVRPGAHLEPAVMEIAERKARWFDDDPSNPALIIAADTLVEIDGNLMGKPGNKSEAFRMISELSGKQHRVSTGICVRIPCRSYCSTRSLTTNIWFKPMTGNMIHHYIESNPVTQWAGGYAIQGEMAMFLKKIEGDYLNVVGLPLSLLHEQLLEAGFDLQLKKWIQ